MQTVARPKKAKDDAWGENKKPFTFVLTETASVKLDALLEKTLLSRSEILERAIRHADFERLVDETKPTQGSDSDGDV
jgi:hypothetical protein